ncbi:sterol desaturase family protein [Pseudoalteromonas sp. MMG022]|uniref:sterol desaturase family protein n=1 Tax=Pseudoalteromonas sp. MMG022 TaxID=2909978 RepID=UPI001F193699|nr:sterol desaturase family protein [Pseudoalteromonas sp. MMG022]MCF6435036.1 sterol desaturase family protein [Pseudoalteromonas sp. MMG022]
MKDVMELNADKSAWSHLLVLVWPAVMAGSLAMYWWLIGPMAMSYEMAIQFHFLGLLVGIFILELIIPYHKSWNKYDRQGWNDFLYNITFPAAQIGATAVALAVVGAQASSGSESLFNLNLPFVLELIIMILIVDLIWYICHRSFHTLPMLWKFHSLHHNSHQLHVLNNARVHPLEVFTFFLPIMLVVLVIDVPPALLNWYFAFQLTVGLLTHSNVAVRSGWLSYIFNTPELHHWHHSQVRDEHDNNYGSVSMIWDHIFGSYLNPKDRMASKEIGVSTYVPEGWFSQLWAPLKRSSTPKVPTQSVVDK